MTETGIGKQYDRIAAWWNDRHQQSEYGVQQVRKALAFAKPGGSALDIGCGSGGRLIDLLEAKDFDVTGLDASSEMVNLARGNHPNFEFIHGDIVSWNRAASFDFILAWDSLFHLPLDAQQPVLEKLCALLAEGGVLIYSFGDGVGSHVDQWHGQDFQYSSIGIDQNLKILAAHGLSLVHLELDQFPEKHVYLIAVKKPSEITPALA